MQKLNEGKLKDRCSEGEKNYSMRVPRAAGKSRDGTTMPGLPEIPENKYHFDGGTVKQ